MIEKLMYIKKDEGVDRALKNAVFDQFHQFDLQFQSTKAHPDGDGRTSFESYQIRINIRLLSLRPEN